MTRTLTLYSRPGCHLCEHVETELYELLQGRRDVAVRIVDITDDPVLEREYLIRIPVLTDGATELSEYPLDRARVERWLAGE
jgi:glutaredoxin